MKQAAFKQEENSIETTAWELYEVGSIDEVVRIARENPKNDFLNHLGFIAVQENTEYSDENFVTIGISPLANIAEAYRHYNNYSYKESAQSIAVHFRSQSPLTCFSIYNFSINTVFDAGMYELSYNLITRYKKDFNDDTFIKAEIESLFHLKKFNEMIRLYKSHKDLAGNRDIQILLGLALYKLGKGEEATKILESIPEKAELPSFDEKKSQYSHVIEKIPELEKHKNDLSYKELTELGFAYLFNEDFNKAEATFNLAISLAE